MSDGYSKLLYDDRVKYSPASKNWDVFISHAHEDKEAIARPLAEHLQRFGLRVWYDEFSLRVGDSLNESINHGLAQCRYGVIILSPNFVGKKWTRNELNGLVAREELDRRIILPIWHEITAAEVKRFSPILADRVGVQSSIGIEAVAKELIVSIGNPALTKADGGIWQGSTGRLCLSVSPSGRILGDYDWKGAKWAGHIEGEMQDQVIRFIWYWDLSSERGDGLLVYETGGNYDDRYLRGGWAFDYDCVNTSDAQIALKHPKLSKWEFRFSHWPYSYTSMRTFD